MIRLPYFTKESELDGYSSTLNMVILLPEEAAGVSIDDVSRNLTTGHLQEILYSECDPRAVGLLTMPKFTLDTSFDLMRVMISIYLGYLSFLLPTFGIYLVYLRSACGGKYNMPSIELMSYADTTSDISKSYCSMQCLISTYLA
jgi:hypothetical protein